MRPPGDVFTTPWSLCTAAGVCGTSPGCGTYESAGNDEGCWMTQVAPPPLPRLETGAATLEHSALYSACSFTPLQSVHQDERDCCMISSSHFSYFYVSLRSKFKCQICSVDVQED